MRGSEGGVHEAVPRASDFGVASKSAVDDDLEAKKDLYERLGVREYCVYDPLGGLHWPRLQLFRLVEGAYRRVVWRGNRDGPLVVTSEVLGLELRFEEDRLRLWDPGKGTYLLEPAEQEAAREAAEARAEAAEELAAAETKARREADAQAEAEAEERRELEAQIARLQAQLAARGKGSPPHDSAEP